MSPANIFAQLESLAAVIAACISGCGLLFAAAGLFYSAQQLKAAKKIAQGDFLLHLDEMFRRHDRVHRRLRPGGDWHLSQDGPANADEWADVDSYMGLFERIKILVDNNIIDLDTIERLYGYRIYNIVANDTIREQKISSFYPRLKQSRVVRQWTELETWENLKAQERENHPWCKFVELWDAIQGHRQNRPPD